MTNEKTQQNYLFIIHTDGGARGNPGPAAAAFVVIDSTKKVLFKKGVLLGTSTNNFAEYSAVLYALEWLTAQKIDDKKSKVLFNIDSLLVVNQLNGLFKIKKFSIREQITKIKLLETSLGFIVIYHHIPRAENYLADRLVNETLDNN
ncbi:MAG: Ribonuclease H [Microgenomates group bacterium GW2011_GWA2_44_7]|nr:MAG: Ribonuclease H [Microgenomates group bacterium GW2011_GWA2_44_7]KKT77999.1 MAG: Ribonuclease H [Microgenomates group bacterium GW2011_GWB1_44_8]